MNIDLGIKAMKVTFDSSENEFIQGLENSFTESFNTIFNSYKVEGFKVKLNPSGDFGGLWQVKTT